MAVWDTSMEVSEGMASTMPVKVAVGTSSGNLVRHILADDSSGSPSDGNLQPCPGQQLSPTKCIDQPEEARTSPTNIWNHKVLGCIVTSLRLNETSDISKTGTKDDSVLLDSSWLAFLSPLLEELSKGDKLENVWNFNYPQYLSVFHQCCLELKVDAVPYQARHSGPSIDRAANSRTQEEVRKRGGWLARQSVARYEKAGRLAATWQKLPSAVQLAKQQKSI